MGHQIDKSVYAENVDKNKVQADWDYRASHDDWQEGCSGLPGSIRWIDKVFNSYEEADKYIDSIDRSYAQLAVKFKEPNEVKVREALRDNKKILASRQKIKDTYDKFNQTEREPHFKDVKSQYIGCRICGSKINKEKLFTTAMVSHGNLCPVCREDWRPESKILKIKAYKEKWQKAQEENKELEEKIRTEVSKKYGNEVKWLVKTEYHV